MRLPTTSYAVLGLLSIAEMSGYELAQFADRSVAHFWPISKSQVYGELGRLEELGYVTGTEVVQEKLPDKRMFRLTASGRRALDHWLQTPGWERARYRSGFLVKVMFAHRMSPGRFADMLSEFKDQARAERDHLQEIVDALDGTPDAFYSRATALLGLRSTEAALRWADEVLASLPESSGGCAPDDVHRRVPERRPR